MALTPLSRASPDRLRAVDSSTPGWAVLAAVLGCLAMSACDTSDGPPAPPTLSLTASASVVDEADNPTVLVSVQLDAPPAEGLTVQLNVAGSATRGRDYALESTEIAVAPNRASGFVEIDVYRDFEAEGDETITVALASVTGRARVRGPTSLTLSIVDGEAATVDKAPPPEVEPELVLLPFFFGASGDAVVLVLAALNSSADGEPALLVAEWSTDIDFNSDIHTLGRVEVAPTEPDPFDFLFGAVHEFRLPLDRLAPNRSYFVRAYLGGEPPKALPGPEDGEAPQNIFLEGFSTDAQGQVKASCVAPARRPAAISPDPAVPRAMAPRQHRPDGVFAADRHGWRGPAHERGDRRGPQRRGRETGGRRYRARDLPSGPGCKHLQGRFVQFRLPGSARLIE